MKRDALVRFFDETLRHAEYGEEYSNNGLQIEGAGEVTKIAFAVDAVQETIDRAAKANAQMLFVHHGLSWGSEPRRLTGVEARRFGALFRNGISLYASHLPLDAHPVYGNNAQLADHLALTERRPFCRCCGKMLGFSGNLPVPKTVEEISGILRRRGLEGTFQSLGNQKTRFGRAAIVSGAGGNEAVSDAAAAGIPLLITGELTHVMHHYALESGVTVLALGHYASEVPGPVAMEKLVSETFGIETVFIDCPTGK